MTAADQLPLLALPCPPPRPAPKPIEGVPLRDRRGTPVDVLAACAVLAGVDEWTLDVAAETAAHCAPQWYSPEYRARPELIHLGCVGADGLEGRWVGDVWCHPPVQELRPWVERAWYWMSLTDGPRTVGLLAPADRTDQPWWHDLVEPHRDGRLSRVAGVELASHHLPGRARALLLVWRRAPLRGSLVASWP